jgi:hypothetical protein
MPRVRLMLDDLAAATAPRASGATVPDLGPAAVMDQLTVLTYDACEAGRSAGLEQRLADLRRSLSASPRDSR